MSVKCVAQYDLNRQQGFPFVRANIFTPDGLVIMTGDIKSIRREYANRFNTICHGAVFTHRTIKYPDYSTTGLDMLERTGQVLMLVHKDVITDVTLFFPDGVGVYQQDYRLDLLDNKRRVYLDSLKEVAKRRHTWVLYERVYNDIGRADANIIKTFRRLPNRHIKQLSELPYGSRFRSS